MAKDRVIQIGVDLDTSGMLSGINQMRKMLGDINVDSNLFKDVNKDLDKITTLITSMNSMLKNGGLSEKDIKPLLKDLDSASKIYTNLPNKIRQVAIATNNIRFPSEALDRLDEIQLEIDVLKDKAKKALGSDLQKALRNAIPTDLIDDKVLTNITKAEDKANSFVDTVKNIKNAARDSRKELDVLVTSLSNPKAIPANASDRVRTQLMAENQSAAGFSRLLSQSLNNNTLEQDKDTLGQLYSTLGRTPKQLSDFITKIDEYVAAEKRANEIDNIRQQVLDIISNANLSAADATARITQLIQEQSTIERDAVEESTKAKEKAADATEELADTSVQAMKTTGDSVERANIQIQKQDSLLKQLASRATSLIGIGAVFNYITRGIRDAWNGIKELDKEFTQIAVVTDKTTSQLWQSFGTYSQMAQALGVATKDAVATSALYYQQGLDTADVMTLTAETIKMAQIAGMDFATATNQMTAAIRGFNLEMSDASKVNDIFSTLAANAAVSTQELSYALTKTASIAESAGMSIDTTSAFLTKMIETTREAPENIGTAMKSIVARFEELKKNPLALSIDVEGEEVVANKVEAAIALAGVKLRDETTGQFRDLDDVFLELAKSWDSLDRNTQRYIATIAAGSRQQSRFIALMDGYDRTLELTEIAQDSEGQSAAQFLKTLDSLDSKLNKVRNSLEQLYQKFVDSDLFGGLLTGLNDFLQSLGKLDAGQIAVFLTTGVMIGNSLINGIKQAITNGGPALSNQLQLIMNKTNNSLITKSQEKNGVLSKIFNFTSGRSKQIKQEKKDFLNNKITQEIEITGNIEQKTQELQTLKTTLESLKAKKGDLEIDLKLAQDPNEQQNLQNQINNIVSESATVSSSIQDASSEIIELEDSLKSISDQEFELPEITEEQKKRFSDSLANAASTAGPALVAALSVGITTAIETGNPFESIGSGLLSYLGIVGPALIGNTIQLATTMGTSFGSAFVTAGGPYVLAIGAVLGIVIGTIALISNALKDSRSEAEKLQEEIDKLKEAQADLDEKAEKSTAEYSISKIATKKLDKLVSTYDELSKKTNRTSEENEKLNSIIEDLGQDFPDLVESYDEAGNAVLRQRDTWDEIIEKQKESNRLALIQANTDRLNADINSYQTAITEKKLADVSSNEYFRNGVFSGSGIGVDVASTKASINGYISQNNNLIQQLMGTWFDYQNDNYSNTIDTLFYDKSVGIKKSIESEGFNDFLNEIETINNSDSVDKLQQIQDKFIYYFSDILGADKDFVTNIINSNTKELTEFLRQIETADDLHNENNELEQKVKKSLQQVYKDLSEGVINSIDINYEEGENYSKTLKSKISKDLIQKSQDTSFITDINTNNLKNKDNFKRLREAVESNNVSTDTRNKFKTAFGEDFEYVDEEWFKDEEKLKIMQSVLDEFKTGFITNISNLTFSLMEQIKQVLSEEDFNIISQGDFENQSFKTINSINEKLKKEGIDTSFIDTSLEAITEKMNTWSPSFTKLANNISYGLADSLMKENVSDEMADVINKMFEERLDVKKAGRIVEAIKSVSDWGNLDSLKGLTQIFYDAGDSAEQAAEDVLMFANALGNAASIDIDAKDFDSYFSEVGTKVQDAAKDFKDLYSALEEYNEMGRLSAQTIIDLVAAGKVEYLTIDETSKALKLNTELIEKNWHEKMNEATASLDMEIAKQEAAQAGLDLQIAVEQRKLDILKKAASNNGRITASELNELRKLENTYAIDVVNGRIDTNSEIINQNIDLFKSLFIDSAIGYEKLVEQAVYYGEKIKNGLATGIKQDLSGMNTSIDIISNWGNKENRKNISDQVLQMPDSSVYVFKIKELNEEIKKEQELLEALKTERDDRAKILSQLQATRDNINKITSESSFVKYMKDTGKATKDSNKELEDYVSTLEKYYTLQKQIEKTEKDRQKALNQYKKTGDTKYLQQYISESENTLKKKGQLAYVGRTEKDISMATAKTKLASYFTADELKQLQFDSTTGLVDYDKFRETQAYKSKTQDNEQGKEIEDILKTLFSDVEKYQGWIDDYDDFAISYQEELEDLKKEAEKIAKSIDRLQNINQAMESIKEVLEEAKDLNEEYFSSGGREGIGAMQYLKTQAEGINSENLAQGEYKKLQAEYAKEFTDKGFDQYIDKTSPDGKIYYKQGYAKELTGQGTEGQEQLESLQDLVGKYNELTDAVKDSEKAQRESAKAMREYARSLKKSYSDLITRVADDMAALDQKQIDEIKKKYAMIQEEDDKYLDALQKSIDKQRQLRDQANSYDDLEKQEKRLALLERDTSGANAAEIAALKEQIKDARQNLVDTEQDNIVNNISEANTLRKDKMDEETTFLQNVMDERTYDMQYYLDKARDIVDAAINGDAGAYQQMLEIMQEAESEFYRVTREAQDEWLQSLTEDYEKSKGWVEIVSAGYDAITNETVNHIKKISDTMADSDHGASELSNKIDGINKNINIIEAGDPFKILNANLDTAITNIRTLQEEIANGKYDIEIPIVYKAVGDVPNEVGGLSNNLNNSSTNSGKGYVAYKTNANGEEIVTGLFSDETKAKGATHGTGGNYKYVEDMSNYRTGSSLTNEQESSLENYGKTYGTLDWDEQKQVKGKDLGKELNSNEYYGLARNTSEPEVYGPFSSQYSYNPNSLDDLSHAPDTLYTGKELEEKLLNYYGRFLDDKLIRLIPIKYKEGGLVNYTGPAWVDGTSTSPEAFLSADDTRNFQELAKILQSVLNFDKAPVATTGKDKIQIKSGDTNIEIHIEVDKIDSEESMEELCEMMADKIQQSYSGGISQP